MLTEIIFSLTLSFVLWSIVLIEYFFHIWKVLPPGDKIPKERICGSDLTSSDLRVDVIGDVFNVDPSEHRFRRESKGT